MQKFNANPETQQETSKTRGAPPSVPYEEPQQSAKTKDEAMTP